MLERTRKKLREADYFLGALTSSQPGAFNKEPEAADFHLSAFVTAARAVTFVLRKEQGGVYETWKLGWFANLTADDKALMDFFVERRNEVQKEGDFEYDVTVRTVSLGEFLKEFYAQGGTFYSTGMPGTPQPTFQKVERRFAVRPEDTVPALCRRYLDLVKQLVADFERDLATNLG